MEKRAFALLLLGACSGPAAAQSLDKHTALSTSLSVLAFNAEGSAALVRVSVKGGGGEVGRSFEMWSAEAPHRQRIELPAEVLGTARTPAAAKICVERLGELDKLIKKRGFRGVSVQTSQCTGRGAFVTVDKARQAEVNAANFKTSGNKLVQNDLEVRFRNSDIGIFKDEKQLCGCTQAKREAPVHIHVAGSKSGRLVYVTEQSSTGDQGIIGLCGAVGSAPLQTLLLALP